MKKTVLLTALLLVGSVGSIARADTVMYSTKFDLVIDPTTQQGIFNNMALSFLGVPLTLVDAPTNASLGSFVISGTFGADKFIDMPFNLQINQYIPTSGSGEFTSVINGVIKMDSSTAFVAFDQPFVQIGDVTYTLTKQSYTLNADSWLGFVPGTTTVQALITETPEPGSLLLLGSGLLGMALILFRRAKATRKGSTLLKPL